MINKLFNLIGLATKSDLQDLEKRIHAELQTLRKISVEDQALLNSFIANDEKMTTKLEQLDAKHPDAKHPHTKHPPKK